MTDANVSAQVEQPSYAQELEQRLDDLIAWAIAEQPHKIAKISDADFSSVREAFLTTAKSGGKLAEQRENESVPEPSEGGPQYINDNPAPWP